MKKIAIITSVASMVKQFNMQNISILKQLGCNVTVISNFTNPGSISVEESKKFMEELREQGIKAYDVGFARSPFSFGNLKAFKHVKRINLKEKFDVIHCQSPVGGVIGRLVKKRKQRLIYTAHGFHFYKNSPKKNWVIFFPIEKLLSFRTDILLTINSEDFELSKQKLNAKKNIQIPGVGINTSRFSNLKKATKKDFGFSESDFLLIYGAELNNNKNQKILVNAMKYINKFDDKIKLLLVGKGEQYNQILEMIKEDNLENSVILLGYRNDLNIITSVSDVAVASSIREGLGMFVLEAMYLGLPVIASDNRGHSSIVKSQINGFLFELNGGVDLIVKSVLTLRNNKELYNDFSNNSKKISKKFTDYQVNSLMKDIYLSLLSEG